MASLLKDSHSNDIVWEGIKYTMTLYFDTKVEFLNSDAISTIGIWHPSEPIFTVASLSQERGGSVTIFSDAGEPLRDVTYPVHSTSQATALAWHPKKIILATGWENGDIYVWFSGHREFASVHGPHKASITLLAFSEMGGRMVAADSMGLLTGWRFDGKYQFLTMFSHDLREHLLLITFRKMIENEITEEMVSLAKAAVAGDENALDTLTNWRPRTAAKNFQHTATKDNHCFYVSTQSGVVYYINQGGTCTEVLKSGTTAIRQMLWHPKKDAIICLMEDMAVVMFLVEATGILTELDRVKLSGRLTSNNSAISWAGSSIAIITGDFCVRIWDVERGDNFLLNMDLPSSVNACNTEFKETNSNFFSNDAENSFSSSLSQLHTVNLKHTKQFQASGEVFTCLAYCQINQTLCAGTNQGNIFTWKRSVSYFVNSPENSWQLTNISNVRGSIKQCSWGINELVKPCIMLNCISNVYVLKEQPLLCFYTRNIWALQRNAKSLYLEHLTGRNCTISADYVIINLTLNQDNLILSNGRCISSYKIERIEDCNEETNKKADKNSKLTVQLIQTFPAECFAIHIQNQSIFCLTSSDIAIYSVGGVVLNKIQSNEVEGKIIGVDLTNTFLTVFTMKGIIKTYDVTRHDPKLLFPGKACYDLFEDFGEVIFAKCNSIGTHLAIIIANKNLVPIPEIYCWNFERNILMKYVISDDRNSSIKSSLPINFYWDTDEARLLAVEIKSVFQKEKQKASSLSNVKESSSLYSSVKVLNSSIESEIVVLFYSEKGELHSLESSSMVNGEQLISLCIPNMVSLDINIVKYKPLQDFIDLNNCDVNTRKQVLNFSLHVAEGNMDLAYRCIRSLQSKTIWNNLAKMCVETSRLDVAKVCLGHLEKARSVRAVRQSIEDDDLEPEAKIAVLATELGMIEKAQELYKRCERVDLLNKLLLSSGKLNEALELAENEDRINLKNNFYRMGQECKEAGDIKKALEYFEKTQNSVQNVTQILLENPELLKRYMQNTKDPLMLKWWGQYIESSGDMESALAAYQKADDWFSQVKILCYLGKMSKADAVARQSGDRAACYHLARHYENIEKFQEAIMFYTRAQTFSNAIRICKENDFQDELWTVASSARSRDKATAAAYFEECGSFKRSVELYHRAGMLHKALEMAFESKQPEILEVIASELAHDSDPELIYRCGEFFTNIEQHQKAVILYSKTKHFQRALRICSEKGVPITDELGDLLTPKKTDVDEETRVEILTKLGELLQEQGDYHTATKKFTQAGDKIRAMKSLLKSGNTDKIIFFANMSRQREVYIMAANYLQALNWQENPSILKNIVTYYSKGQAFDSLANFYAICAQIEIDEFLDYEKALIAMQEAAKCLEKLGHTQNALQNLQRTITEVKTILQLENALKNGDNQTVVSGCRTMLIKAETPPIRHVHILALLIRALAFSKQYAEAGRALKELAIKENSWKSLGLLDKALVQKIAEECNLDFHSLWNSGTRQHNENEPDEEEIQEELQ